LGLSHLCPYCIAIFVFGFSHFGRKDFFEGLAVVSYWNSENFSVESLLFDNFGSHDFSKGSLS
jgi:hypothetical protein